MARGLPVLIPETGGGGERPPTRRKPVLAKTLTRRPLSKWWLALPLLAIGSGITLAAIAIAQAARGADPVTAAAAANNPGVPVPVPVEPPRAFRFADEPVAPRADGGVRPGTNAGASAEARLIAVYRLIGERRLDEAQAQARRLVADEPTFRLAHLVLGDLLAARAAPLRAFGGRAGAADGPEAIAIAGFQQEARLRLQALGERPEPGTLPRELLRLPASTPYVVAVDTSRARLYLVRNASAQSGGPRVVADFYTSIGKQGTDKRVEGDQRTPLGVYFITGRIDRRLLEDRFGVGALPLNYPNALDRLQGRTGSGILLHGVASDTYSRPPLDSDGCVVVANDDLLRLAALLPERDTPVLIAQSLDWVRPDAAEQAPKPFLARLQQWQQARTAGDAAGLLRLYRPEAEPPVAVGSAKAPRLRVDEFSAIGGPGSTGVVVVTYRERSLGKPLRERWMRQYWKAGEDGWKILIESPVRVTKS